MVWVRVLDQTPGWSNSSEDRHCFEEIGCIKDIKPMWVVPKGSYKEGFRFYLLNGRSEGCLYAHCREQSRKEEEDWRNDAFEVIGRGRSEHKWSGGGEDHEYLSEL